MRRASSCAPWPTDALIRGLVVTAPRAVGIVGLWATRKAAEDAVTEGARRAPGGVPMAGASSFTLFEAPLLVDAQLRADPGHE